MIFVDFKRDILTTSVQPDAHIQVHTEVIFILVVVDQETETYISMFYVNNNSQWLCIIHMLFTREITCLGKYYTQVIWNVIHVHTLIIIVRIIERQHIVHKCTHIHNKLWYIIQSKNWKGKYPQKIVFFYLVQQHPKRIKIKENYV